MAATAISLSSFSLPLTDMSLPNPNRAVLPAGGDRGDSGQNP